MTDDPFSRLAVLKAKADAAELTDDDAREWYRIIVEARRVSDYYERALIRYLKWGRFRPDRGLYWREVAEVLGVESKQGAHQRWARLAGPDPNVEPRRVPYRS